MSVAQARFVALICRFTLLSGRVGQTNALRWSVFLANDLGRLPTDCSLTTPMESGGGMSSV